MRRVSVAEIMQETGLSRATVDRALNGRGKVHPRTADVIEKTLLKLKNPASGEEKRHKADIVLRLGRGMMGQMRAAWDKSKVSGQFLDMYQANDQQMIDAVRPLCGMIDRPLIITSKNTDGMVELLSEARRNGKRIISVISDLSPEARDCHVGSDGRAAGQTAAFLIGRSLGDRPTPVGVLVGDTAFRCHEDREIGFRSGLRGYFPKVVLAGEARGEDSAELTKAAVLQMLRSQPALTAIYNVGGGNAGLTAALKEAGRSDDMLVVGHEVNLVTTKLLREGSMDYAIAADPFRLLQQALILADTEQESLPRDSVLLDFAIHTRFNLPSYSIG